MINRAKTVLRFVVAGTNVDFFQEEVKQHELMVEQNEQFFPEYGGGHYIQKLFGIPRNRFIVTFNNIYKDTLGRIEQLYDHKDPTSSQPAPMQFFYEYGFNTETNMWVQMKRDDMKWFYSAGYKSATQEIGISFIETKPGDVGVIDLMENIVGV